MYRDSIEVVAGIDSSTQSTKVELRDIDTGRVIGFGRVSHPRTAPPRSEQRPDAWWSALIEAMAMALAEATSSSQISITNDDIVALSVAAQQHGLVVLDSSHTPLRDAKLWNDTESAVDSDWLLQQLPAATWAQRCGSVPVAAFTITKLAWLKRCEPRIFAKVKKVLLPHDWLNFKLTGEFVTDRGDASGTGYWSPVQGKYQTDLLSLVDERSDWSQLLPEVLGPWAQAGELTEEAATTLGLRQGTRVAIGTGDNMAGALGLGLRSGDVSISIGTSGTVYSPSQKSASDPSGLVAGFADATGQFLPLACTLNATLVTDAMGRILSAERDELDHLAMSSPRGSGGLTLLPYLAGERTPNRPEATGAMSGTTLGTSREMMARAAFEGVVCGLLDGLDALTSVGVSTAAGRLLLIGGGAQSPAYQHVVADLANRDVTIPQNREIVATGAAVQAAILMGSASVHEVATRWNLLSGASVEPSGDPEDSVLVRRRYSEVRG
jgi:xylulokinase